MNVVYCRSSLLPDWKQFVLRDGEPFQILRTKFSMEEKLRVESHKNVARSTLHSPFNRTRDTLNKGGEVWHSREE